MVPRAASDKVSSTLASDSRPFVPIWYVTANRSAAKIAYPIDLLAAVLDGSLAPSTQVRDDAAASWITAADHPRIAPLLSRRDQMTGGRWLFAALTALIGLGLLVPLFGTGFHGWITLVGFGFLVGMLRESYNAAIESIELTRGRRVLLYLGGIAACLIGLGICGALIELGRLSLSPGLPEDSDWLAIPLLLGSILVFVAVSTLLWERWKPYGRLDRKASGPHDSLAARGAQITAKAARLNGLLAIDGCHSRVWSDGDRYAGKVKEGKPDGHGVFTWANGARHEGEWRAGKRHGHGVAVTADGSETAGRWTDDHAVGA
jgi:hypothetical protein